MSEFVEVGNLTADEYGNIPPKSGGSVGSIRGTIAYTDTSNKALGELPFGAVLIDYYVEVKTAFDDSTTDVLEVGYSDDIAAIVDALDVSSAGLTRAGAGATTPTTELNSTPLTEPKTIYGKYTGGTADPSEGSAVFVLLYTREES